MDTERMEIGELLAIVAERGASDLHLSTGMPPMLRVDGDMRPLEGPALAAADVRGMVRQVMGEERRRTLDGSQEVDFACELPGGRPLPGERLPAPPRSRRRFPERPLGGPRHGGTRHGPGVPGTWRWRPGASSW